MAEPDSKKEKAPVANAPVASTTARSGGLSAWLPLIITLAVMPVLAYCTTIFLLVPQLKSVVSQPVHAQELEPSGPTESTPEHETNGGEATEGSTENPGSSAITGREFTYSIDKLVVNVNQTFGQRYLMVSIVLTSQNPRFEDIATAQDHRIKNLSIGALRTKTIEDLEQPQAINQIRTELKSIINNTISRGFSRPLVDDLYFTEFAVQ